MTVIKTAAVLALLICAIQTPALSANYAIDNPADRIINPVDKMYNPATDIKNPASTIYNPASRMDNPNPLSPVNPQPAVPKEAAKTPPAGSVQEQSARSRPPVMQRNYNLKTVGAYIIAAKKAFRCDNYREFIAISEDALRRIDAGTLRSSQKTKQTLIGYRKFGYGMLDKDEE